MRRIKINDLYKDTLAATIKENRKKNGLTQERLSWDANMSNRQYARIETGVSEPDLQSIFKLCLALDVHYSELLEKSYQEIIRKSKTLHD